MERREECICISADPARIQLEAVCDGLSRSYWADHRPRQVVARSLENSLCFGAYDGARQIGFARVVTDRATFAWLCDVFVQEEYRGRGVSKRLMEAVMAHPDLQGLRRWLLATRDAHSLYERYGFVPLTGVPRWMERYDPDPARKEPTP